MSAVDAKAIIINVGVVDGASGPFTRIGASAMTMGAQTNAGMMKAQSGVAKFGATAAKVGTFGALAIAVGLALSAKAAITFESSFAGVRKTVETSEAGFRKLADGVRQMAMEIPIGVNELNRIMELGGQLGVDPGSLLAFADTIAKIGVTTTLSTEEAAMGFARLDNIMQLGGKSFDAMGATVVDLGNNFAATENEILTFATRIAPAGATVGMTMDNVFGLATAFTSVGVPAERGGTAVQKSLIKISQAVMEGGVELDIFAKTAGMTADAFADMFEDDPAYAFEAFVTGLGNIREEGGDVFGILESVELGNQRVISSLLAMANAEGVLIDALDMGAKAWGDNTALAEEAQKRFETTASALIVLKNKTQDIAISLGSELLPAINDFIDGGEAIIDWTNDTDDAFKSLGLVIGGFVTVLVAAMAHPAIAALMAAGSVVWRVGVEAKESASQFDALKTAVKSAQGELTGDAMSEYFNFEGIDAAELRENIRLIGFTWDQVTEAISGSDQEFSDFMTSFGEGQREAQRNGMLLRDSAQGVPTNIAIPVIYFEQLRRSYLDVASSIASDLAASVSEIDLEEQALWDSLGLGDTAKIRLKAEIIPAPLDDDQLGTISDAIDDYVGVFSEGLMEIDERLRENIDLWYEWGDAVVINVDDMIANMNRQVTAEFGFEAIFADTEMSGQAESVLRSTFGGSFEAMEAFVLLWETNKEDFDRLLLETEAILGPDGDLMRLIFSVYNTELSGMEFTAGADLLAQMAAIAAEVAEDPSFNVAEAWLGVIVATLIEGGPALAPQIIDTLIAAFGEGGIPGVDQTIEELIELARALSGLPPLVETEVRTTFTTKGDPIYGAPIETPEPNTGGGYTGGRSAFGGNVVARQPQWVGELGPEIFVPFSAGAIIPNSKFGVAGDRTTNVYIERPETNDLPGDISEGLTRASISEQVDMIGAY